MVKKRNIEGKDFLGSPRNRILLSMVFLIILIAFVSVFYFNEFRINGFVSYEGGDRGEIEKEIGKENLAGITGRSIFSDFFDSVKNFFTREKTEGTLKQEENVLIGESEYGERSDEEIKQIEMTSLSFSPIIDNCPDDPLKTEPGICGCGISDADNDHDGLLNCHEDCPNDPVKITPGICGCGIPDRDSDNDSTPDCTDQCSLDPAKILSGVCGCGVADTDTDGDGTSDCIDGCPNDPTKTNSADCFDPIAARDTDWELYMMRLVNRARKDPAGEAARIGTTITDTRPPAPLLAYDSLVDKVASNHNNWEHDNFGNIPSGRVPDSFSHYETMNGLSTGIPAVGTPSYTGVGVAARLEYVGYPWSNYGENILANFASSELLVDKLRVETSHRGWWNSGGHRANMLNSGFTSFGFKVENRPFTPPRGGLSPPVDNILFATQNFGRPLANPRTYLFGLIYTDLDGDGAWTPREVNDPLREGIVGKSFNILLDNTAAIVANGTIFGNGAFSARVGDGTYDVVFPEVILSSGQQLRVDNVIVAGSNVDVGDLKVQQLLCGNGIINGGEQCDDGNTINTDACKNNCQSNVCGDGIIKTGGEQCDDGNSITENACPDYGQATCVICNSLCMNQTAQGGRCGDNYIQTQHEQCDGNNLAGKTCSDFYYTGGALSCDSSCNYGLSQCTGLITCPSGHTLIGGGRCKFSLTSDVNSGDVWEGGLGGYISWDQVRKGYGILGGLASSTASTLNLVNQYSTSPSLNTFVKRVSLPFDTSSIPDNAIVNSAELKLSQDQATVDALQSQNNFITLVKITLGKTPFLNRSDFENFGSVDNPIELANRENATIPPKNYSFIFNQNGLNAISKIGYTQLGIKGGYELFSANPNGGAPTTLSVPISSETATIVNRRPLLTIIYTSSGTSIICGNGAVEKGEACDDGNTNNNDGCNNNCQLNGAACGNGIVDQGEQCDDGNTINGDGCQSDCRLPQSICGNGIKEGSEQCDDGNNIVDSCAVGQTSCTVCGPICTYVPGIPFVPLSCPTGHIVIGGGMCQFNLTSDIYTSGAWVAGQYNAWNQIRAGDGSLKGVSSLYSQQIPLQNNYVPYPTSSFYSFIYRVSLPFNTSSLPDNAIITSVELKLSHLVTNNNYPNSTDFITIVKTSLSNPPYLGQADYKNFGSVDNPIELANRIDISTNAGDYKFIFNQNGQLSINKTGYTQLGLRGGYDVLPTIPNNGQYTAISDLIYTQSSTEANKRPVLSIKYTLS